MNINLPSPLTVVCHDAGATNLIIPWLKQWEGELRPVMAGPASIIWKNANPEYPAKQEIGSSINGAKVLLTGTGWASTIEHDARVIANRLGVYSIAVIDHWVNYQVRFIKKNQHQLPNEIWVSDSEAEKIVRAIFPNLPVLCYENNYMSDLLLRIESPPNKRQILYVLEPIIDSWGENKKMCEFQALDYAIEKLSLLHHKKNAQLILRPHPSESRLKYQEYIDRFSFISIDKSKDLAEAISNADFVIGVETSALVVALNAGRPTLSTLPPWAHTIRLPHTGILQIRDMTQDKINLLFYDELSTESDLNCSMKINGLIQDLNHVN